MCVCAFYESTYMYIATYVAMYTSMHVCIYSTLYAYTYVYSRVYIHTQVYAHNLWLSGHMELPVGKSSHLEEYLILV